MHDLGTDPQNDHLVYDELDEAFFVYLHRSRSQKYLFLTSQSSVRLRHMSIPHLRFVHYLTHISLSIRMYVCMSVRLVVGEQLTTEVHYVEASNPHAPWKVVMPRKMGVEYAGTVPSQSIARSVYGRDLDV